MELLTKNIENSDDRRQDNSDKKPLFEQGRRPRSASEHKEEWSFIEDITIRENIAYQMQYLEFQIFLYNDYQIYLTIESLLCKNIMAIIGGVVESALCGLLRQTSIKGGFLFDDRIQFLKLIDDAYTSQIIDRDLRDDFHQLRKMRNLVHLSSIEYQEYQAYGVAETNQHIEALSNFINSQKLQ